MKKAKNIILVLFVASLAIEYLSSSYELFIYPENITLVLALLVIASIVVNIFSKEEKKKKFLNKEVVIVLAIIPFYGLLDYFTEFHWKYIHSVHLPSQAKLGLNKITRKAEVISCWESKTETSRATSISTAASDNW